MEKLIELLKYLVLSIVQGIGEVLPISSSGHLLLIRNILTVDEAGLKIELILHLASLLALFVYYRKTISSLIYGGFKYFSSKDKFYYKSYKFLTGMIVSLVPTCIAGYFLDDYLDNFIKYPFLIGIFLIFNALNLYSIKSKKNCYEIEELSFFSFLKIGLGQCLGLIPGFSRSGSALAMCYRENLNKDDSEKFTFLMLFPLVIGSIILNIDDFYFSKDEMILLIISFIITFVITLFSIRLLNKVIKSNKLHYFSYYCLIIGILVMFIG